MGEIGDSRATLSDTDGSTELSINNATLTSVLNPSSEILLTQAIDDKSHASVGLTSGPDDAAKIGVFPFLELPAELRVRIYRYLLHACRDIRVSVHEAEPPDASRFLQRRRFSYRGKMRTYEVNATGIRTDILSVNRQTYLEGSRVLYSENCFNFSGFSAVLFHGINNLTTLIPFLRDRSEGSCRLIKRIKFGYVFTEYLPSDRYYGLTDDTFEEICEYLSQNLQLERITMTFVDLTPDKIHNSTTLESYLMNLHKLEWIQRLVPLVKNLDTFTIIQPDWSRHQYSDALVRAAQIYLESKMHKASKTVCESQIRQELAGDAEASKAQHRLEL